jgi:hypothetical protein
MTTFTKLEAIRQHLQLPLKPKVKPEPEPIPLRDTASEKRVQKNLSILESDAARLATLAKCRGLSQARLLTAALDAYERADKRDPD